MLVRSKCSRIGAGNSRDSRDPVKLAGQGPGPKHRHGRCIPSAHRSKAGHHRPAAGHSHDRLPMPMLLRRSDGPRFSMDSSSRRGEAAHKKTEAPAQPTSPTSNSFLRPLDPSQSSKATTYREASLKKYKNKVSILKGYCSGRTGTETSTYYKGDELEFDI
jgi:hypothetical protein